MGGLGQESPLQTDSLDFLNEGEGTWFSAYKFLGIYPAAFMVDLTNDSRHVIATKAHDRR